MDIREYEFTCPICNKDYITYVDNSKLQEIYRRQKLMQEIFPNYSSVYREIFITKVCSHCQTDAFKDPDDDMDIENEYYEIFDVEEDASNTDKEKLRSTIEELVDQEMRG